MKVRRAGRWLGSSAVALLQGATAGLVCVSLACPVGLVALQPARAKHPAKTPKTTTLTEQQKTLHALNRLTFGPQPGEAEAVNRTGLERWFERQLHPDGIADTALEARLSRFPAMQLTQTELMARFPSPPLLRQYIQGAVSAPADPVERAIYADAAFGYEQKRMAVKEDRSKSTLATGMEAAAAASNRQAMTPVAGATPAALTSAAKAGSAPGESEPAAMDPASVTALLALVPQDRFQRLLAMSPEEMQSLMTALRPGQRQSFFAGLSPVQTEQVAAMQSPSRVVEEEAMSVRLLRDVYSERQLQAVMTDFWLNHFNIFLRKNQNEPYLLPTYEREAILPNALGRFEDLLVATAKSPAMLVYLDNWESIGPNSMAAQRLGRVQQRRPNAPLAKVAGKLPKGINENYARELMELHTLGVNGGYTQQDVIEVAKCFTGWTIDRPNQGGEFTFNPNRHEPGSKTVLGHVIPEGGESEGLAVLHILATSPATAHFISRELADRFVSDNPPQPVVDAMTRAYLRSGGDIKAVLAAMFHSPAFWSADVYRAKVKTPVEFVASALRAGDAEVSNPLPLVQAMGRLGMPIYGMQTPNGYSWQGDAWVSSNALLTRMNFALVLSANRLPGTTVHWGALLSAAALPDSGPDAGTELHLERAILGEPATLGTRRAVLNETSDPGAQQTAQQSFRTITAGPRAAASPVPSGDLVRVRATIGAGDQRPEVSLATMAGLLLGSPDFQRR